MAGSRAAWLCKLCMAALVDWLVVRVRGWAAAPSVTVQPQLLWSFRGTPCSSEQV